MLAIRHRIDLNYRIDGSGEPALLLFNGATLPLEFWDPVVEMLSEHFTIVRFDQRNAGATSYEGSFTLADVAADAASLLDHLRLDEAVVIGHAWGGRVAQLFARDYPHRVRALVICATGGQLPAALDPDVTSRMRDAARERDRETWSRALEDAFCADGFSTREPHTFNAIADLLWDTPPNRSARWDARACPSPGYWGLWPGPALLLYGRQDKNGTPENAENLQRTLADSRLVFFDDAGHFVVRERPVEVASAITSLCNALNDSGSGERT
ncbi:MAG: alpha/beta hydrolase [Pseudomonadales bacterium]|jgi:pimeloyl-ACP methyl ester carboxylesterase|nr:alpha/beta hydrolase [Pseudomonadales bacterium]MDP6472706.1 alpha/beta hydrolase [Pseudomonadales bacterium]MDP6827917.1 alpha/beta hydrolase [Pseudomonadales bacterium]MDP6973499.1 alpha/beta hydrolase [Pseudomonadales bacterium]|tara:strand:- start:99 stop:905 length:807 start_codon:yes stop_codon:yes gene_type:complete